ncbi:MAG: hypothetical protein M3R24_09980 [Chloroflexota bacterium]|nr:hypothetical protein [Chloroflexota bacterium]
MRILRLLLRLSLGLVVFCSLPITLFVWAAVWFAMTSMAGDGPPTIQSPYPVLGMGFALFGSLGMFYSLWRNQNVKIWLAWCVVIVGGYCVMYLA